VDQYEHVMHVFWGPGTGHDERTGGRTLRQQTLGVAAELADILVRSRENSRK